MFVIVRDEDPPTVAAAISSSAHQEGFDLEGGNLEPGDLDSARAFVSASGDQVVAWGLESLAIGDADEWGTALSAECETEVIAIDVVGDALKAFVFDGGQLDREVTAHLDASGHTRLPELAEFAESEEGERELERGIAATSVAALLTGVLRCLGATPTGDGVVELRFRERANEVDAVKEDTVREDGPPRLVVETLPAASLIGAVGGLVTSPHGNVFGVTIAGIPFLYGVRLEFSGDALGLFTVKEVHAAFRVGGKEGIQHRAYNAPSDREVLIDLADAFLEPVEAGLPTLDAADLSNMFTAVQRMMSATDERLFNTVVVHVSGTGRRAGEGSLVLSASSPSGAVSPAHAAIPVRVTS